jgi:hypothetical protein
MYKNSRDEMDLKRYRRLVDSQAHVFETNPHGRAMFQLDLLLSANSSARAHGPIWSLQ